jgi:PadR family transcriptional regulator, regulatory protein PadR
MQSGSKSSPFMNGVPELLILRELARQEMYGYQLVRAIQARTEAIVSLSEGCVYPLVHSLERKGWLASRRTTAAGRVRVYYRLTPRGRGRLQQMTVRWDGLASAIGRALGAEHEQPRMV